MNVRELLGKRMLFFDGGMGSMLQKKRYGLRVKFPELLKPYKCRFNRKNTYRIS